jgi:hypothetical protein
LGILAVGVIDPMLSSFSNGRAMNITEGVLSKLLVNAWKFSPSPKTAAKTAKIGSFRDHDSMPKIFDLPQNGPEKDALKN